MLLDGKIPVRYVLGKIKKEIVLITLYVVAIFVVSSYFNWNMTIPLSVPMILGTVISMLLAFRANQAYDRWWEARIIWGGIVNDSRSWARQVSTFINNDYNIDGRSRMEHILINRQIAWNHALGRALRKRKNVRNLSSWLSKEDMEFIERYDNVPMAILELQARDIKNALDNGWINTYQHVELDRTLTKFSDHMGKCERIKNTIFPSTYGLYLHWAMNLFLMLLPFALIEHFGWVMMPLIVAIASTFWLIEKMSVHLQDPFENKPTDTPVTTIALNIERDLKQVLRIQSKTDYGHLTEQNEKRFYVL